MNDNRSLSTATSAPVMGFDDMEKLARAIIASGLFGIKTTEQAIALMMICQADGINPAKAAQMYHIIQGRAALKAEAMLARFQQAGGKIQWGESSETTCEAEFSHPSGGTIKVRWTIEDAKRAGLIGKDNWKSYPRQMLRARVVGEGVRATYPGVLSGFKNAEELSDLTGADLKPAELAGGVTITAEENGKRVAAGLDPIPASFEAKAEANRLWERLKTFDKSLANVIKRENGTDVDKMIVQFKAALAKLDKPIAGTDEASDLDEKAAQEVIAIPEDTK